MRRTKSEKEVKIARDQIRAGLLEIWPDARTEWAKPGDEAEWLVHGQKFVGLGESNDLFIKIATPVARGLYDLLSDRSHPSLLSLDLQTEMIAADGVATQVYVVPRELTEWQTQLACLTLFKSMQMVASYHGLNDQALVEWGKSAPPEWFS